MTLGTNLAPSDMKYNIMQSQIKFFNPVNRIPRNSTNLQNRFCLKHRGFCCVELFQL